MRRQIGIMSLIGLGAFTLGGMAAFASGADSPAPVAAADDLAIVTSTVTITAAAPSIEERADLMGMTSEGQTVPFGYSYVVYFPAGTADLTGPAQLAVAAIAEEVTDLELSRVTLSAEGGSMEGSSADDGPYARTQVVREALIELGVPARWIGEAKPAAKEIGPISMAPLNI
jgi:outer membrane protein OmpA-like peptidoglycan-associated protein